MQDGTEKPEGGSDVRRKPGSEAPEGTAGTGDAVCPQCRGTGRIDSGQCPNCLGTGTVTEGIGGG